MRYGGEGAPAGSEAGAGRTGRPAGRFPVSMPTAPWEHAQFGSLPCNNSRRGSSHTLTHTLYSSPQWERRGAERLPAEPGEPGTQKHTLPHNKGESCCRTMFRFSVPNGGFQGETPTLTPQPAAAAAVAASLWAFLRALPTRLPGPTVGTAPEFVRPGLEESRGAGSRCNTMLCVDSDGASVLFRLAFLTAVCSLRWAPGAAEQAASFGTMVPSADVSERRPESWSDAFRGETGYETQGM